MYSTENVHSDSRNQSLSLYFDTQYQAKIKGENIRMNIQFLASIVVFYDNPLYVYYRVKNITVTRTIVLWVQYVLWM